MPEPTPSSTALTAERSPWLRGPIRVPGDPLLSHFALLLAGLARGESVIENAAAGPGVPAMARVLEQLGVQTGYRARRWHVPGIGVGGFLTPDGPLDTSGMGAGTELLLALLAAHDFDSHLLGVADTPVVASVLEFFARNGTRVDRQGGDVLLRGSRFAVPFDLGLPGAAAHLLAPLLLAASVTAGISRLNLADRPPTPIETTLAGFGARLTTTPAGDGRGIEIDGMSPFRAQAVTVPADPTLAVYPTVAAMIAPDSEVTVEALSLDRRRFALIDALQLLGADVALANAHPGGHVADLVVRHGPLTGTVIPASLTIAPEDFSILAVAAAFAAGETVFEGLGEGQRRFTLTRALRDNGIECEERAGGLAVRGQPKVPGGGNVTARLDPKLAMSFLVLGMATDRPVTIDDGGVMAELFPDFVQSFEHIGASFSGAGA